MAIVKLESFKPKTEKQRLKDKLAHLEKARIKINCQILKTINDLKKIK